MPDMPSLLFRSFLPRCPMPMTVTVYTVPNCSSCEAVKRFLGSRGVPFTEKNVREDPAALAEMQARANVRIAPVVVIGEQAFYGTFDDQRPLLEAALRENGV
ncbi:glutaredoxin family protein [Deinococcus sp. UR1]|nr:glutaredoxin family protein [Deinococcus sp. UR1]GGI93469.1 NrdH-redoxin [Deinococcus wulumuqiensis]GGP31261.1 NrdH-redoxin [Deinococcus wulumuqiensis]SEJ93162.1 Glutaredoxin [Deinococcus reticulitermitis]